MIKDEVFVTGIGLGGGLDMSFRRKIIQHILSMVQGRITKQFLKQKTYWF